MSTRSLNWLKLTAVVAPAFVRGVFFAGLLGPFPRHVILRRIATPTPRS